MSYHDLHKKNNKDLLERAYFRLHKKFKQIQKKIKIPKKNIDLNFSQRFESEAKRFFKSINFNYDSLSQNLNSRFYIPLNEEIKSFYINNYIEEANHSIEITYKILNNDFSSFHPDFKIKLNEKNQIDWHLEFNSGKSWELKHWSELDISSEKRLGDVRMTWELNRFQFLFDMGKAYFLTQDEKVVLKFIELIESWIEQNPIGYGVNWAHSQETAIRMVSWIWGFYFFKESKLLHDKFIKKFLFSLYQHASFTYYDLSLGYITHNHLISESAGLFIFSYLFRDFPNAKKWIAITKRILEKQILKQIWESGPSGETSTNYHFFVLDSILECDSLLRKNKESFSKKTCDRIEKMLEYGMYSLMPDGSIPLIGDNDSGRALKLSSLDPFDKRRYLSLGAARFNNSEFKFVAKRFYEDAFWLLGPKGYKQFETLVEREPLSKTKFYPEIGILYARNCWKENSEFFVFRPGITKLRKGVSFGHAHSDCLSFIFSKNNRNFFIDPGVYTYSGNDNYRFHFRSSQAHNTIYVDNLDFFPINRSRFGLNKIALANIRELETQEDSLFIKAEISPLENSNLIIQRTIFYKFEKFIFIADSISAINNSNGNASSVSINFLIDQNIDLQLYTNSNKHFSAELTSQKDKLSLMFLSDDKFDFSIYEGSLNPLKGWNAPRYNLLNKCKNIVFTINKSLPAIGYSIIAIDKLADIEFRHNYFNLKFENENYIIQCDGDKFLINSEDKKEGSRNE